MALITETGTGEGSKVNNVTIRAWIVLLVTVVSCISSMLIISLNCWAALKGQTVNVVFEPVLASVLCLVIGWYFGSSNKKLETKESQDP